MVRAHAARCGAAAIGLDSIPRGALRFRWAILGLSLREGLRMTAGTESEMGLLRLAAILHATVVAGLERGRASAAAQLA